MDWVRPQQNGSGSHGSEFSGDGGANAASGSGDNGDLPGKEAVRCPYVECDLLAADDRMETSAVSAIRILTIKGRTKGMTLAFGKKTYL